MSIVNSFWKLLLCTVSLTCCCVIICCNIGVLGTSTFPNIPNQQLSALKALYDVTNGQNWIWYHDIENTQPWNFTSSDPNPCFDNWQGITCNSECSLRATKPYCVVVELKLDEHNLNGTLPDALGNLTTLTVFNMSANPWIQGSIPQTLSQLTSLQSLSARDNVRLAGSEFPDFFDAFPDLYLVDLSRNFMVGLFPSSLYSLRNLVYVDFDKNELAGTLNEGLCDMMSLQFLFVSFNNLTGSLPDCLDQLQSLNTIDLSANRLTGTLPSSLYRIESLVSLTLNTNLLEGTISNEIVQMPNLYAIELHYNILSGTIPLLSPLSSTLRVLSIHFNGLQGLVPVDRTLALSLFTIGSNFFTGSTSAFNTSQLLLIYVGYCLMTGTIPNDIQNQTRALITEDLLSRIASVSPIFGGGDGEFIQKLSDRIQSHNLTDEGNRIISANFRSNFFTGRLPDWTFSSPLLFYFYADDNWLTGSIPTSFIYDSVMIELFINDNALTGTIPESIYHHPFYRSVWLASNQLSGTIPSILFERSNLMKEFIAYNNKFTGPLPQAYTVVNELNQFSVANNQLTGSIPVEYFNELKLYLLDISNNCLSGSLPEEICDAQYMQSLIMDGLTSSTSCRRAIFPSAFEFNSFALRRHMQGTIPSCIFEMPRLQDLYISGNELRGTIPSIIKISGSLENLRLSYNRLTGTIPEAIQNRSWATLDLSYNKLHGHLSSQLAVIPTLLSGSELIQNKQQNITGSLFLDVNRLSGRIPSNIQSIQDINILNGNIFECRLDHRDIPSHDPKASSYSCASDTIYQVLLSVALIVACVLLFVLFIKLKMRIILLQTIRNVRETWREWNRAFEFADHQDLKDKDGKTSSISNEDPQQARSPFRIAWTFFRDLRKYCLGMAIGGMIVLMPTYRVMNLYVSMFEEKYRWEYSSTYMTGRVAGVTLICLFTLMMCVFCYLFMKWEKSSLSEDDNKQTDINPDTTPRSIINTKNILTSLIVGFINTIMMLLANAGYLIVLVFVDNIVWIILSQVALASLKIIWNDFILWRVLRFSKALALKCMNPSLQLKETYRSSKESTFTSYDATLIAFCLLFNNIIAPCLGVAFISPSCYSNAFFAAPPTDVYYPYCDNYLVVGKRGTICLYRSEAETSFSPPFIYSYNCASLLPVNYLAVFVYMAIVGGIIIPAMKVGLIVLFRRYSSKHQNDTSNKMEMLVFKLEEVVPFALRPIYKHPSELSVRFPVDYISGSKEFSLKLKKIAPIFNRNRFVVRVVGFLALLISFGVVFPPLGVVMALAIVSISYFEQLNIGRILYESGELGYGWYREKLGYDVDKIMKPLMRTVFATTMIASLLFATLVFDTIGDHGGMFAGLIGFITMVIIVRVVWAVIYLYINKFHLCLKIIGGKKGELEEVQMNVISSSVLDESSDMTLSSVDNPILVDKTN